MIPGDERAAVPPSAGPQEFAVTRIFDAPRTLLFAAWTEQQHLKEWFGPAGFTVPISHLNLVPGGVFHYCMRAANGIEMWGKWTFQEILPPQRLVLVNTFSNKHGNLTRHPYVPDWPLELLTAVTFSEIETMTVLNLRWSPIDPSPREQKTFNSMHEEMSQGWNGTFNQLATYLATLAPANGRES